MTQVTKARELSSPERLQAFTDAVVAIALTLLILPLMESVGELADHDGTTAKWLAEEQYALLGFALSFILIAVFWVHHHRLFRQVKRVDSGLLWLTVAWMFTIVVMPVATSLSTQMRADWAQPLIYIGTLFATSLVLLLARLYLRSHPDLHDMDAVESRSGIQASSIVSGLFLAALLLALAIPGAGNLPLLLMLFSEPLQRLARRRDRRTLHPPRTASKQ
ncbi:putative membrane protein [Paenarthrobacter nitroguajacolicus]|uniref:TMEM175 family protein n=1 Tax=Paenarthrobacter TaxID=1742992 RepID=UPI002855E37D|nr:TMEM175 family protein [Paenarthrobacter nitroguajacolicus]MDR6987633.1 putative membrane protein [Paenarthrobacter nitroguajacolicus]